MIAYKLFHRRKDGSLGPLFINRKQRIPIGEWEQCGFYPTKGYAEREGWHATLEPKAPHLRQTGDRVWCKVQLMQCETYNRPESQGGTWVLAKFLKILEVLG